ncbi:MAG: cytochrome C oxidase subunit IV family protein [Candidatus Lambdaproteobacteria bacterium]|nr:cytochrome C oxidase subunit IV family protein [Candidatus Lambdaproteobacteria bacterium]
MSATTPVAAAHGPVHGTEHEHPGPKTYAKIAIVLTVITAGEIWVFYIEQLKFLLVPVLSVLSAVKFALVAMFYMHLKFDHPVFTRLLLAGMVLALGTFLALLALFTWSHPLLKLLAG